jgi:hypothetical protein
MSLMSKIADIHGDIQLLVHESKLPTLNDLLDKQTDFLFERIAELEKERDETSPLLKKLLYCCEGLRCDYSEENYGDAKNWLPHIDSAYGKYRDEIDDIEALKEKVK